MKASLAALLIVLAAAPALRAEDDAAPHDAAPGVEEGLSLLGQGAQLLLEGLAREMEPAMREMAEGMEDFAANLQPMLQELSRLMDDLSAYHLPERLPNGDILIRRKQPGEPGFRTPGIGENGETDL